MILSDPTWQIKHFWRIAPSRKEISKVLGELQETLRAPIPEAVRLKVYLTSDELLRNSLEHGCFTIGATKKAELLESEKFEDFLSEKEGSSNFKDSWIEFEIEFPKYGIVIHVRDSGTGYQIPNAENKKSLAITRLSQRGFEIIQNLSSSCSVSLNPTETTATFILS